MATIIRLKSGHWRVQVRRKQSYASETFLRHEDARKWAIATERRIDLGEALRKAATADPTTLGDLVDLHVDDMREVGKAPRRSKRFTFDALKAKLGKVKFKNLTRERLIQFGKDRAKEGASPVTLSADFGYLKLVLTHAAAVHGVPVSIEPVDLARVALKRLGLIGKSRQRDRRPTADELERLLDHFDNNRRLLIPMGRIVRYAIASAMGFSRTLALASGFGPGADCGTRRNRKRGTRIRAEEIRDPAARSRQAGAALGRQSYARPSSRR